MIATRSAFDYLSTTKRLSEAITRRGLTIFCRIDHAAAAKQARLDLQPEKVFIFGNPQAGTPLMNRDPTVGYELPLRILVWQEADAVQLAYRDPRELAGEFNLDQLAPVLDRMSALLKDIANEVRS